jgi:hypothetical protein
MRRLCRIDKEMLLGIGYVVEDKALRTCVLERLVEFESAPPECLSRSAHDPTLCA